MIYQPNPVNLGTRDKSAVVSGFTLTETVRSPGLVIPPHYHEHCNISLVLQGSFIETVGHKPYKVSPGSLIMRPAGEMHRNSYEFGQTRSLIIEVEEERVKTIGENFDLLNRAAHIEDPFVANFARRIHSEFRQSDDAARLSIEGLILEMLAQVIRQNPKKLSRKQPRWLGQARDFIHAQFSQPISLSQIAKVVGVHPSHLAKVFRSHYRCTLGEYVRRLRLKYAAKELTDFDKSISGIALTAGFYDQSHFTHAFKLRYGVTPSEFRILTQTKKCLPK